MSITLACGSSHPQAIRAAKEFPEKLFKVHGDKIRLRDSAVYYGNGTTSGSRGRGIDVSCSLCGHEWSPRADNLLNGKGCPNCRRLKNINSAGKRRCPRATPEEKQRAIELRATGITCKAVAEQLFEEGLSVQLRDENTVMHWTNPNRADKVRLRNAKWDETNREQKRANNRRYYSEFSHGKAANYSNSANRRLLKTNTPEYVFLDGEWHEVDRKETYRVFGDVLLPPSERAAIEALYTRCQEVSELSGIEHHVDHVQPLSKGGEHCVFNLQLLSAADNLSKNNTFTIQDQRLLATRVFNL
jgi:5-methylcytosine-specific restriction endonuclease McrA